jgi:hypothetical protein
MENNWKNVFDAYPEVDEIFVVDDMPFLEKGHAEGHSNTTKKPVKTFRRADLKNTTKETASEEELAAAAEAKAEKEAAAAEVKAAKEAAKKTK